MPKKKSYGASDIDVHLGLDGVRQNPQVYISAVDSAGILNITKEAVENSIDEAVNGYGNSITIVLDKDDYIWVIDEGRGIPVETHKKTKKSTLTTILTTLSAGGKMKDGAYANSGGVHGMGISITNALSSELKAWTYRKKWYSQTFEKGKETSKLTSDSKPKVPYAKLNNIGTVICFKPDKKCFDKGSKLDTDALREYLQLRAYLCAGVKFILYEKSKKTTFVQKKGLQDYLDTKITEREVERIGKPFIYQKNNIDLAICWSTYADEDLTSFVNGLKTIEGGTHLQGMYKALAEAIRKYKTKKQDFRAEDIRNGIIGAFNYKLRTPKFSSQIKDKLITAEATNDVYKLLYPEFVTFFNKNKSLAKNIIKRAVEIRGAHAKLQVTKKAAAKLKNTKSGKSSLPSKLKQVDPKTPAKDVELFLVEGDSAAGPAANARDKRYQEVLSLRGKILNVYKDTKNKTFESEEVLNILKSIGYDPSLKDPISKLRVGKVILLMDADQDGHHIDILILSLLQKVIPEIFTKGMVYKVEASLFSYVTNKKKIYADTLNELRTKVGKNFNPKYVTRLKGWGESTPSLLKSVAFDPETRKLKQINTSEGVDLKYFVDIVSLSPETRKKILGIS